ncbi:molybdopterin synthase catalytic subunit [Anoxybacillus voinovskiensis]|uniref:Molybdopterin synthase catalytic subunit n=1 Tax=Anoxybacteroides voinovskiense TaxID=230470 RepID=A0A840DTT8_9BACL|nr:MULTISPECIES: hypothetical protein [Anoxybacillus]MBB4073727.1 molybdopterin synthase catalytic subunit [Anoxybacillus voinovskiensis]MCL6586241.1 hypothetical protein [Anoxybacillus sp.]GGJ64322.1 hypothetical protein GCM10008982_12030 [Anoxybacillus voinovskiensis]
MEVGKKALHDMIEQLSEADRKSAYDFLSYLLERPKRERIIWEQIEEDEEPLTEEERQQLQGDEGYVTGSEAKREFGLQVDLP